MKAEEEFGQGQYMYIGSGQYVAVDGAAPVAGVQPPNVSGATVAEQLGPRSDMVLHQYGAAGNVA